MPVRAFALISALTCLVASTVDAGIFRDHDRDRDREETIKDRPSPPEVLEARSKADTLYQQGDYLKVVEITTWLIDNFPSDNPHFAYHLRASAKVELGKAAGSPKQVREGIADARTAIGINGVK